VGALVGEGVGGSVGEGVGLCISTRLSMGTIRYAAIYNNKLTSNILRIYLGILTGVRGNVGAGEGVLVGAGVGALVGAGVGLGVGLWSALRPCSRAPT
jgi:hypothetical protein